MAVVAVLGVMVRLRWSVLQDLDTDVGTPGQAHIEFRGPSPTFADVRGSVCGHSADIDIPAQLMV
jgi:hypothetical protein